MSTICPIWRENSPSSSMRRATPVDGRTDLLHAVHDPPDRLLAGPGPFGARPDASATSRADAVTCSMYWAICSRERLVCSAFCACSWAPAAIWSMAARSCAMASRVACTCCTCKPVPWLTSLTAAAIWPVASDDSLAAATSFSPFSTSVRPVSRICRMTSRKFSIIRLKARAMSPISSRAATDRRSKVKSPSASRGRGLGHLPHGAGRCCEST